MRSRITYRAAAVFSLLLAAAGAALACLTFSARLGEARQQAVVQHQSTLYGLKTVLEQNDTSDPSQGWSLMIYDSDWVSGVTLDSTADLVTYYVRQQHMMQGDAGPALALLDADGELLYNSAVDEGEEPLLQTVAAAPDTMRLDGQRLLLSGSFTAGEQGSFTLVTSYDASAAFAARRTVLLGWAGLQAVLTLAALLVVRHTTAMQQLNDRQSRFVADLTHELKTPLTGMIGYADLLRGGELDPDRRRRAADAIYHESTRLEALSRQLLALQGLEGGGTLAPTAVPVAGAFADAARSLPDLPYELTQTVPAGAAVRADRVLLADLLRNLALNAAQAEPKDGKIDLTCTDAGHSWRLAVADTGCGIPPEALPHLTEPFYRVDKARARANGGSGIGLSLCAQIAAAFGTRLEFESVPGQGTTVSLLLPKEVLPHDEADQTME